MIANTKSLSSLLLASLIGLAASQGQNPIGANSCVTNYDANVDYFPIKITVDDAALFNVEYKKNYKVVKNTAPTVNMTYVLTQCGTPAPEPSLFPGNAVFVTIPVSSLATLTTTSVSFIEMLGMRSTIKAVDTEGLVSSPCIQYDLEHNSIIGLEDYNRTLRDQQFDTVNMVFGYSAEPVITSKTVITSEVSDPGPLNRAEWLEFYSTFYNLEDFSQQLTAGINNNYNCFKSKASAKQEKPYIAWTSYVAPSQYNNNTASWSISSADYKRILTTDAGATFYNGTTASSFTNVEDFKNSLHNVDIIIDETMVGGADMSSFLTNYHLVASDNFKFLKNSAVYREDGTVNPNDGRDWFSSAVVMADAVLQDVIRTVHPDVLPADTQYNWIRNIAKNETQHILKASDCSSPDSNSPISDRALNCSTMKVSTDTGNTGNTGKSAASSNTVYNALTAVVLCIISAALSL